MAWAAQYVVADGNVTPVNQTWNRTVISEDHVVYVNDTARASGTLETMEFRRSPFTKGTGLTAIKGSRWNAKLSSRILASETEPLTMSFTLSVTDSLANSLTAARIRFKTLRNVVNGLMDTDAEVDDVTATRMI